MKNGDFIYDTDGHALHAHGGYIIRHGGYWYWYGEDRRGKNYVSCYRSSDLRSWEFRRHVLTTESECRPCRFPTTLRLTRQDGGKVNIERPKVLFCEATGQFVMWAHYENGVDYCDAAACVATCSEPDGDFVYRGHFKPFGHDSRDCTLFYDGGDAYFISTARDNADLHIYRLSDDFMSVDDLTNVLFQGEYREAPAVFKRGDDYYMLSSQCTGWRPNQGGFSRAAGMSEQWSMISDFGDETTYHSQPAFVLPVDDEFYYIGDRWGGYPMSNPFDYGKSSYVILKIKFTAAGDPYIDWTEESALF